MRGLAPTIIVGLSLVACSEETPRLAVVLEQVRPTVTIARPDRTLVAAHNDSRVEAGARITTDEQGGAVLRFPSGSRVSLASDSSVTVEGEGPDLIAKGVHLEFGTIEVAGQASQIKVDTRLGPVTFSRGDNQVKLSSAAGGDTVQVETKIGTVEIQDRAVPAGVVAEIGGDIEIARPDAGTAGDSKRVLVVEQPIEVVLSAGIGLRVKQGGTGSFRVVPEQTALAPGDIVEAGLRQAVVTLGTDGEARLFKGARALVRRGNGRSGAPSLELQRGRAVIVLRPDHDHHLVVGDRDVRIAAAGTPSEVEIEVARRQTRVSVNLGESTVLIPDQPPLQLLANETARFTSRTPPAQPRQPPGSPLRVTAEIQRVWSMGKTPAITFVWPETLGSGPFLFDLASDATFTPPLINTRVRSSEFTIAQPELGAYFWRVRSGSATHGPFPLTIRRLRPDSESARRNVVRGTGERTVLLYQQFETPEITFLWMPSPDAVRYRLQIYRDRAFKKPVVEETVSGSNHTIRSGVLTDGRYLWAVAALGKDDRSLSTSDMYELEIKFEHNRQLLRVHQPRPGTKVGAADVLTTGMVAPGSALSINGRTVKVDDRGRFRATVPPLGAVPFLLYRLGSNIFSLALR